MGFEITDKMVSAYMAANNCTEAVARKNLGAMNDEELAKLQNIGGNPGKNEDLAKFNGVKHVIELPNGYKFNLFVKGDVLLDGPIVNQETAGILEELKAQGYANPRIVNGKLEIDNISTGAVATVEIPTNKRAANASAERQFVNSYGNAVAENTDVRSGQFNNVYNAMKNTYSNMSDEKKAEIQQKVNAYIEAIKTDNKEQQAELRRTLLTDFGSPDGWLDPTNGQVITGGVVVVAAILATAYLTGGLSALAEGFSSMATAAASHPALTMTAGALVLASCGEDDDDLYKRDVVFNGDNYNISVQVSVTMSLEDVVAAINSGDQDIIDAIVPLLKEIIENLIADHKTLEEILSKLGGCESFLQQIATTVNENNAYLSQLTELANDIKIALGDNNKYQNDILEILQHIADKHVTKEDISKLYEILQQIEQNLETLKNDVNKRLDVQNNTLNEIAKNGVKANILLQQILAALNKLGNSTGAALKAILEAIAKNGNKIDDLNKLLQMINNNVIKNGKTSEKILEVLEKLGLDMLDGFNAILEAIQNGNTNLEAQLAKILNAINLNTEQGKKDAKAILDAINKLGINMMAGFANVLAQGEKGQLLMKEILAAIKNLNIGDGSNTEAYLQAILEAINNNGGKLDDITALLKTINENVVNNGKITKEMGEKILEALKKMGNDISGNMNIIIGKMDAQPNYTEILNKILAKLGDIDNTNKTNFAAILEALAKRDDFDMDRLMAKLDEILNAIKDHEVHVEVDVTGHVTCTCNGNCPNEGIIEELNDILG